MENKKYYIIGALIFFSAMIGLTAWGTYNNLVSKQVEANQAIGDLNTELQRRFDLIPNMIKTAEASMKFQTNLVTGYAEAREGLSKSNKDYQDAIKNSSNIDTAKAMQSLDTAKANWAIIVNSRTESVPQAQLDQISELNNEMSALENVIAYKRQKYNAVVGEYNKIVVRFPSSSFASYWRFTQMKFFEAQKGAEKMPVVNFNI